MTNATFKNSPKIESNANSKDNDNKPKSYLMEQPYFDHCFDKNRLKKWIRKIYYETIQTEDLTILNFIEALKTLGFQEATKAGISIGIEDLKIPPKKRQLLKEIEIEAQEANREFTRGRLTALENFQNFIDIWHRTSETIKLEVVSNFESTDTLNPVYMMAFSGARGNLSQVTQLVGMRGFMSDPEGQIIDYPIRSNFREGLTLTEYIISCYGARKGLVDTALRTADAGYLTRRLVDVAHRLVIVKFDCRTKHGIFLSEIQSDSKTLCSLQERLVGRVLAEDIQFTYFSEESQTYEKVLWKYFPKNQQLDLPRATLLASCYKRVLVRSPLKCLKKKRLCQLCYGWTLPHAHLAPLGEAVGILAAQSIGEPGTQLTMRTFHTGGVFSGTLSDDLKAPYSGIIQYSSAMNGSIFRALNGKIGFRTLQDGTLFIRQKNKSTIKSNSAKRTTLSDDLSFTNQTKKTLFELEFPAGSILFLKQDETVQVGDLLIKLPKQQGGSGETVLNTYTYYSNRSGLLTLSDSELTITKQTDPELVEHPKLPKIDPFYQRTKTYKTGFYSLLIHAGQTVNANNCQTFLAKPGDLINTNSVINQTQLINLSGGNIAIELPIYPTKKPQLATRLEEEKSRSITSKKLGRPSLKLAKSFGRFPFQLVNYKHNYGYCFEILDKTNFNNNKNGLYLGLPKLSYTQKAKAFFNLIQRKTYTFSSGNLIYAKYPPYYEFEQVQQKEGNFDPKNNQRFSIQSEQDQTSFDFNWTEKKLNQMNICFFLPEISYSGFSIQQKRKNKKRPQFKARSKKKENGFLLSNYNKTKNTQTLTEETVRSSTKKKGKKMLGLSKRKVKLNTILWVQKKQQICQQENLQKTKRSSIAIKSGFLIKKPVLIPTSSFPTGVGAWPIPNQTKDLTFYFNQQWNEEQGNLGANLAITSNLSPVIPKKRSPVSNKAKGSRTGIVDLMTPKSKRLGHNSYWLKDFRFKLNSGWPISSLKQVAKTYFYNHRQFHVFGSVLNKDIRFSDKVIFSQYYLFLNPNQVKVTTLNSRKQSLRKNQISFTAFFETKEVLLATALKDSSFMSQKITADAKAYQSLVCQNSSFAAVKKCFEKSNEIRHMFYGQLFQTLNKQKPTSTETENLRSQGVSIKICGLIPIYEEVEVQAEQEIALTTTITNTTTTTTTDINTNTSSLSCFRSKYYKNGVNLSPLFLKVFANNFWDRVSGDFGSSNLCQFDYSLKLTKLLDTQNYFKDPLSSLTATTSVGTEGIQSIYYQQKTSPLFSNDFSLDEFKLAPFEVKLDPTISEALNLVPSKTAVIHSTVLSSHTGEFWLAKSWESKNQSPEGLILTNNDSLTFKSNYKVRQLQLGDLIYPSKEVNSGETISYSCQVIHMTKDQIKCQIVENSRVYSNSRFFCQDKQFIQKTQKLLTQFYPRLQMGDIVQGIPKIEEFFEARRTKDGVPFENNLHKRLFRRFRFYLTKCQYPFFIASRKSIFELQQFIIDSIYKLYKSQGIDLSDKHLEIIVKQMTAKVRITQFWGDVAGGQGLPYKHPLPGEYYSRQYIERYFAKRKNNYRENVRYYPAVLGITRAALENDGFISAASFQETTRILSRGVIFHKKDYLKGLKENVILGHIIPAGTAVRTYTRSYQAPIMKYLWQKHTYRILTINHEWKSTIQDTQKLTNQHWNPIRLTLLRILILEYYHTL